jgi:hypothetical protein
VGDQKDKGPMVTYQARKQKVLDYKQIFDLVWVSCYISLVSGLQTASL